MTATEEEWLVYCREERKNLQFWDNKQAYKPQALNLEILKAALSIIVVLPIRKEIKHEWHVVETKLSRLQQGWHISPYLRCSWQATEEDFENRKNLLKDKLKAISD